MGAIRKLWDDVRSNLVGFALLWIFGGGLLTGATAIVAALRNRPISLWTAFVVFVVSTLAIAVVLLLASRPKPSRLIQQEGGQALTAEGVAADLKQLDHLYNKIDTRMTRDVEAAIRGQLNKVPAPERENWLLKILVVGSIYVDYEKVWYSIFRSQIDTLQRLNGRGMKRQDLVPIYAAAAQSSPALYAKYSFDQWVGYMRAMILVREDGDEVNITVKGRDFLKFLIDEGRSAEDRLH